MTITIPTISALPTAPSRTDPATFATRGDAFVAALVTLRTEINAAISAMNTQINADINGMAPLASPVFTGDPRAPTPATSDNDTSIATTAMVQARVSEAVAAGSPGDMILLSDQTVAGTPSTVEFIHGTGGVVLSSTYDEYLMTLWNVKPTASNDGLSLRTSTNAGSSWDSGAGDYAPNYIQFGNGSSIVASLATTQAVLATSVGNSTGNWEGVYGWIRFWRPSAAHRFMMQWLLQWTYHSTGQLYASVGGAQRVATADVDGLRLFWSGGTTFASGRIKLFGRKV